jgi:NadR type nicotinamide-nucleotide adenylyltransferase
MKYKRGVVIGKFYPPHRGHEFLINTATKRAERVTVIVCAKPSDSISGELRGQWLKELHPGVVVMVIDDRYDEQDSRTWAENTIRWLGTAPDVVFTSEDYGDRYASFMACAHELVDRERVRVPCSGTEIRRDPYANWEYISAPVRAWFSRRVCVVGAESTGTTTMAEALAAHYCTVWVPEYGREYSAIKMARGETTWLSEEFVDIAREQNRQEDAAAREANRLVICDTNAFATVLWHRRYMGGASHEVSRLAEGRKYDLYLLTGDEIPFVQDGLRDGELIRHEMHRWFEDALASQEAPWLLLTGAHEQRMAMATRAIDALFEGSRWRPATNAN